MVLVDAEATCNTCGTPMPVAVKARVLHRRYHEDLFLFIKCVQAFMQETDTRLKVLEAVARDTR